MEVNPLDPIDGLIEPDSPNVVSDVARLNTWVALTVAVLATFMAVCKVKDDNIVQAMQQAQADRVDHWGYYQARNLREELASATLTQLTLSAGSLPIDRKQAYAAEIGRFTALAKEQAGKKQEVLRQAQNDQKVYDALNIHDDQFDLSDALLAVAISLLALTSLTHKKWLYWVALLPISGGVVMGMAGLFGWALHPNALSALLS